MARKRREAKQGDKTRYCITLWMRTPQQTFQVDRWADNALPDGTPAVGQRLELPVAMGAYISHGMAVARLSWGSANNGSDF